MKDHLLTACADGSFAANGDEEQSTAAARDALQRAGVTATDEMVAPSALPPDAIPIPAPTTSEPADPGTLLHASRAPPWGVLPPAVERLQPIGLSPLQAAAYLGTSRSRVYRLLREGRLQAKKQGITTLVTMASLKAYAAALPAAEFRRPAVAA